MDEVDTAIRSDAGPQGTEDDTIFARATAPAPAAIAIFRVDGPAARAVVRALFRPAGSVDPLARPRRAVFGRWFDPVSGEAIDEGIAIHFPAPASFTGNDLAEFHTHGGAAVARAMAEACRRAGARQAEPGEFARRAFLNGKMDLARAEAVADLIAAETEAAARAARAQLAGGLSRAVEAIRDALVPLAAEIEARIDFPEEGLAFADRRRLDSAFETVLAGIVALEATRRRGRLLREGATIALVGPPNVGKSSLLNALAREDRAIVTPHAGTTRDAIECRIDLAGVPATLVDTAGLRATDDPVERIGVERARAILTNCDALVEVRDASGEIPPLDPALLGDRRPDLVVLNKRDLAPAGNLADARGEEGGAEPETIAVSARTGEGMRDLEAALFRAVGGEAEAEGESAAGGAVVGERHAALLERARLALADARAAWDADAGGELVMVDLRDALDALDAILGLGRNEAVLDAIFSRFCLGK